MSRDSLFLSGLRLWFVMNPEVSVGWWRTDSKWFKLFLRLRRCFVAVMSESEWEQAPPPVALTPEVEQRQSLAASVVLSCFWGSFLVKQAVKQLFSSGLAGTAYFFTSSVMLFSSLTLLLHQPDSSSFLPLRRFSRPGLRFFLVTRVPQLSWITESVCGAQTSALMAPVACLCLSDWRRENRIIHQHSGSDNWC